MLLFAKVASIGCPGVANVRLICDPGAEQRNTRDMKLHKIQDSVERSCPQVTLRCNRGWGQTLKLHASFCYVRHDPTPPENTLACVITIYLAQGSGISSQWGLLVHCSQLTLSTFSTPQLVIYCTGLSSKPSFLHLQESDWAPLVKITTVGHVDC